MENSKEEYTQFSTEIIVEGEESVPFCIKVVLTRENGIKNQFSVYTPTDLLRFFKAIIAEGKEKLYRCIDCFFERDYRILSIGQLHFDYVDEYNSFLIAFGDSTFVDEINSHLEEILTTNILEGEKL
ncbi:hypothetical protein [Inconstantimicrobium mannanitabidum]|uniref:Uncharacterized protein n=1 Tax=Inconstantimicrobium mannanitabidum TaxID=1604901 RepID=A0ACB5R9E8_9CLOT|nr:hypothetical protein [Clostridium sp. TW13]GKX65660.1 hypothetical protein rsdtw13_09180 [Clostridium sp. TW13]